MNLDIEKIKAELKSYRDFFDPGDEYCTCDPEVGSMCEGCARRREASEALAALEAYDPDAIRRKFNDSLPWIYDAGDGKIYEAFTEGREECFPVKLEGETLKRIVDEINQFQKMKQQYLLEIDIRKHKLRPNQYHGHAHSIDGVWDGDNDALSGCECAACMLHRAAIMDAGKE